MSVSMQSVTKSAVSLAVASGVVLGGIVLAGSAHAATTPTFEPDPNAVGTVALYDANGNIETTGSLDSQVAKYYVPTGGATPNSTSPGNTKATAYFATPIDNSDPQNWNAAQASPATSFGSSASAAYPGGLKGSSAAIAVSGSSSQTLGTFVNNVPSASSKDPNIYQIRVATGNKAEYYRVDVQVDTTARTWTQIYPAPPAVPSISAISANPASPATHGSTVTLSATVSNPAAGTVELFDGTTDKGAATYNAATGAVSATDSPADGTHSYTFVLTSSAGNATSPALSYTVLRAPVAQNTVTVVSGPTTGTVGDTVTYTATVKAGGANVGAGAGTVQFQVDGANVGSPVVVTNGAATFGYNLADTNAHTVTAVFTHASGQLYNDSADTTGVTVTATAATTAPDPQDVVVNVPAGTLVISTPYTAANPFVLGNLVLSADGKGYSASANFGDTSATAGNATADPAAATGKLPAGATPDQVNAAKAAQQGANGNGTGNGITITDTRANSQGWLASAQTTDFTNPALNTPIDGNNLTFHDLKVKYVAGNAIQNGVNVNNIDTFKTAKKSFAQNTNKSPGTVAIGGVLTLTAPTSTKAGQYTATITFTIV